MLKKILVVSAWILCCVVSNVQANNEEDIAAGVFVCDKKEEKGIPAEEESTLSVLHHQDKEGHMACHRCR